MSKLSKDRPSALKLFKRYAIEMEFMASHFKDIADRTPWYKFREKYGRKLQGLAFAHAARVAQNCVDSLNEKQRSTDMKRFPTSLSKEL